MPDVIYDAKFQNIFIAFLLRDTEFLERVIKDVKPDIFQNDYIQRICRLIIDFYDKEHSAPEELIFHVIDDLKSQNLIPESLFNILNTYIDDLFAIKLKNRPYVLKEFDRFLRHQLFIKNIIPAGELLKAGKFNEAEELIKETFSRNVEIGQDMGGFLDPDPSERIKRRQKEDVERFWWLVPEIDKVVPGMKRGELMVLQSQKTSMGKSAGMVFLARNYAFQSKKILIYTLEMSREEYEDRLDMCIAGITQGDLTDHATIVKKLRKMVMMSGQIYIKQFPGYMTKISDLILHKKLLERTKNFFPDAIFIDYADQLAPEHSNGANSFDVGKEIYNHMRGWGVTDNVLMVTGMQSGRGAGEVLEAGTEHAGESIAKVWIADMVWTINATPKEIQEGIIRLVNAKKRNGKAGFRFTIKTDFSRMQFVVPDRGNG